MLHTTNPVIKHKAGLLNLAEHVGIKAVMVHAIDNDARAFYERFGFVQSVLAPDTLFYKV